MPFCTWDVSSGPAAGKSVYEADAESIETSRGSDGTSFDVFTFTFAVLPGSAVNPNVARPPPLPSSVNATSSLTRLRAFHLTDSEYVPGFVPSPVTTTRYSPDSVGSKPLTRTPLPLASPVATTSSAAFRTTSVSVGVTPPLTFFGFAFAENDAPAGTRQRNVSVSPAGDSSPCTAARFGMTTSMSATAPAVSRHSALAPTTAALHLPAVRTA